MHVLNINNKNYLCKRIIRRKKQGVKHELIVLNASSERVRYCECYLLKIQSSWTGGRLIKHLYKTTTDQMWWFLAGFYFPMVIFA